MDCLYDNCNTSGKTERYITCWLCEEHAHIKCAGFNGRHFDKIVDRSNGLRWSCPKCRALDIDFYKLFVDAKIEISSINKELSPLFGRLHKLEVMLKEFKWLEHSSPKRKRPTLIPDHISLNMPNTPDLFSPPPVFNPVDIVQDNPLNLSKDRCNFPVCEKVYDNPGTLSVNTIPPVIPMIRVEQCSNTVGVVNMDTECIAPVIPAAISCDLVVVPPRKTLFISRLSCDTTIERIASYIKNRCIEFNDDDCGIFKFNYTRPRDISSFKILVPDKIFSIIGNKSFWPSGTLVREFVPRERRNPVMPVLLDSAPKN